MDRDDRYGRPRSDHARIPADAECLCGDARRRRSAARFRRALRLDAIRARTESARPSNALRAAVLTANARCRCADAEADQIRHARNEARAWSRARAAIRPKSESFRAGLCGPRFLGGWIRS